MRRVGTLGAAAVVAALLAVPARAATPARCDAFAMSPAFDRDGTALCVARQKAGVDKPSTGVEVHVTTDRGRTWQRRAATGLLWDDKTAWSQVAFSPAYGTDRSIYVIGGNVGIWRTTDAGATFAPVDPTLWPNDVRPTLTPVPDEPPVVPPGGAAGGLLYAHRTPKLLHPPASRPVPGAAGTTVEFLTRRTPGAPAVAVAQVQEAGWHYAFSTCTLAYACVETFFTLARYWRPIGVDVVGAPGRERLVVVAISELGPDAGRLAAWRSGDAFTAMERYGALERVLPHDRATQRLVRSVGVATTASGSLLATVDASDGGGGSRRLYSSDAAGNRWTPVAGWRFGERDRPGARGVLPATHFDAAGFNRTRLWVARDRMFALGAQWHDGTGRVYCSRDGGRSWRPFC